MQPSDITILSPTFYHDLGVLWHFIGTAEKHGLEVVKYGYKEPQCGWLHTHVTRLREELLHLDSSHILFTDAIDVIFNGTLENIYHGYLSYGAPPLLVSMEPSGMNAGGWMGERLAAVAALNVVDNLVGSDPQERWREALRMGSVWAVADVGSRVFYAGAGDDLWAFNHRLHVRNGSAPPLIHLPGGHTDPETGKDYKMKPLLEQL